MRSNYEESVLEALRELDQICQRCKLRLAGVKNSKQHSNAEPPISAAEDGPTKAKRPFGPAPCQACLGVLQEHFMDSALAELCAKCGEAGYDADHFAVAISLPVSLVLRSHSLNLFLESRQSHFDRTRVVPIKQVWKWLFPQRIEKQIGKRHLSGEVCQFFAELHFHYAEDDTELAALRAMCQEEYQMRAKKRRKYHMGLVTRQGAEKSLCDVSDQLFRSQYPVPPRIPSQGVTTEIKFEHNSIFIAGRYNKFSRELPQTPWLVDGVRRMPTSVEELILQPIQAALLFDTARFSSSGREDVDVRALGRGRPFVFELFNPRRVHLSPEDLLRLQTQINDASELVQVRSLVIVDKKHIGLLRKGEDQKRKTYRALCISPNVPVSSLDFEAKLNPEVSVELNQKTPLRVLHRRPNAMRKRLVHHISVHPVVGDTSDKLFVLQITTQAGTYVKEFIHGDFGRTSPCLRQLLGVHDLDILALDVIDIDLEWPPPS